MARGIGAGVSCFNFFTVGFLISIILVVFLIILIILTMNVVALFISIVKSFSTSNFVFLKLVF